MKIKDQLNIVKTVDKLNNMLSGVVVCSNDGEYELEAFIPKSGGEHLDHIGFRGSIENVNYIEKAIKDVLGEEAFNVNHGGSAFGFYLSSNQSRNITDSDIENLKNSFKEATNEVSNRPTN